MKKITLLLKTNSLFILSALALFVGTTGAATTSWWSSYQPECPKELLK